MRKGEDDRMPHEDDRGRQHPRGRWAEARSPRAAPAPSLPLSWSVTPPRPSQCAAARSDPSASYTHENHQQKGNHEGTKIAASEQHQRARATAVRQHHAVAEQETTQETSPAPKTTAADRSTCRLSTRPDRRQYPRHHHDRHADRQRIAADQAAIAYRQPATHTAAHQAEAARNRPTEPSTEPIGRPGQDDDS